MNEKVKAQHFENTTLCVWCGIPLGSAYLVQHSVCVRCYQLLASANLSDEEIFGSKNLNKESSLSHIDNKDKE